jgi:hypothetical protein
MYMDASLGVWIGRAIVILALVGGIAFYVLRAQGRKSALSSVQPAIAAFRAAFAQTRSPGEHDPICVVALHYTLLGAERVIVGVTNLRVLVLKGQGPMRAFPYDYEGEHLGSTEKKRLGRGFFEWSHGPKGYSPQVKNHPPFAGETWYMTPTVPGFPEQWDNLREFANRFYFQWFYG